LQRDAAIKIWGWAAKGEKLTLGFNNKTYDAVADADGKWMITLPKMKAGGPYKMDIRASNEIHLSNILFGDVWLCSGQSNMVLNMERVKEKYPGEIAAANYPEIRNFFIPTIADATKTREDLPPGKWVPADATNVLSFGAATYFFAKQVYEKHHVPIGIINSSVGGTPIEAWISEEGLKEFPDHLKSAARFKDTAFINEQARRSAASNTGRAPRIETDKGLTGANKWFDPAYTPKGWHNYIIPGYWADQGIRGLNGVVWFRKEIDLPASAAGAAAKLFMGRIVDADQVYVNGVQVGNITYQYPPRRYEVKPGILKEGKNLVVVRVTNTAGKGGFVPDKPYYLAVGDKKIDLKGEWQYKVGDVFIPGRSGGGGGGPISQQNIPTALYNAMIAPFINYPIKGILWYQGEANTGKAEEYAKLLPALAYDLRNKFNDPSLPFIYVQLPGFMEMQYVPSESQWATLRESQLLTLSVPNSAMVVAIDLGEWNDIHPLNKKLVGERLALAARKLAYGENNLVSSGPLYQSATIEGNKIRINFTNTGSGLMVKTDNEDELTYFAIAGADKKFVWAKAKIENNTVVVWSDDVTQPIYVRYAWADNPDGANLYNKEGLPASPFRTDR
jgi:sialate O-acetylesterase